MAVVEHGLPERIPHAAGFTHQPKRLMPFLRAIYRGLSAGWHAASDYRQLSELSDRQLKMRGLSRSDIPRSLHERHFASLGGWLDNID